MTTTTTTAWARPRSTGLALLGHVFVQEVIDAGAGDLGRLAALEGDGGELADELRVGAARGGGGGREGAGVGEVGVGVDLEDEDLAGGRIQAHVEARVVAAAERAV